MKKNKTLDDYMKTPYRVNIIPDVDSGSYVAYFPDLVGCITVGDTPEELAYMIEDAKKCWLQAAIEDKVDIPEPCYDTQFEFSGQFKLRLPKQLHKQLAIQAKAEGVSLNQYCVYLLSQNNAINTYETKSHYDLTKKAKELKPVLSLDSKHKEKIKM